MNVFYNADLWRLFMFIFVFYFITLYIFVFLNEKVLLNVLIDIILVNC